MRRTIAILLSLALLLRFGALIGTSKAVQHTDGQPVLIYANSIDRPVAALLSGVPMEASLYKDGWSYVDYPAGVRGLQSGRVPRGEESSVLDPSGWPYAEVIAEVTPLDSVDQNLNFGELHRGDRVQVFGRCNCYWYVYLPDGEEAKFGSVVLNALAVDDDTKALLNSLLPGFPETDEAVDALYVSYLALHEQLTGGVIPLWMLDQADRKQLDDLSWACGSFDNAAYAIDPPEDALTADEAVSAVKTLLETDIGLDAIDSSTLNAQYLLSYGEGAAWHVYWQAKQIVIDFQVTEQGIFTEWSLLYTSPEAMDWTLVQRARLCRAAGWLTDEWNEAANLPGDNMMTEAEARALAWTILENELGYTRHDRMLQWIEYYGVGQIMDYGWEDDARERMLTRPVYRVNIYLNNAVLGEMWFDAEDGTIYRLSRESSGLG